MQIKIHSIFVSILLFIVFGAQAQSGLNFQGVARSANNIVLASQPISLRLSIIRTSTNGITEYTETRKVTTNGQGLFNVVIGDTGVISSLGSFVNIDWKLGPKFLKIEMDVAAGNNFVLLGTTQFQSVAYAQFANSVDAEKIIGVIPVEKGGTGTTSLAALKTALSIDKNTIGLANVNNTADTAKPISVLTQVALDTKVSSATFSTTLSTKVAIETFSSTIATKENAANKSTSRDLGAGVSSDILFPTQKAVKTYVDAQINSGGVADGGITTSKLADTAVTNTKIANGIDKAKVGLGNVENTADLDKPVSTATLLALADKPSIDIRYIAKLNETNYLVGDQNIDGNLTLSTGILNLAGGTQIQSGTNSQTTVLNRPDADFVISTKALSGIDTPTSSSWAFSPSGTLTLPDNSTIGTTNSAFSIASQNGIYFNGGVENESGEWGEIFISPSENRGNIFIASTTDGNTESATTSFWNFGSSFFDENIKGFLNFPAGTGMGPIPDYSDNSSISNFGILSQNGVVLLGGLSMAGNSKSGIIAISPTTWSDSNLQTTDPNSEGNIYVSTSNGGTESPTSNTWTFTNEGNLIFPNLTSFTSDYEGTGGFGINVPIDKNFYINTENEGDYNEWEFDKDGKLIFPDGTVVSGNFSGTSDFGFETFEKGFSIKANCEGCGFTSLWTFSHTGAMVFPNNFKIVDDDDNAQLYTENKELQIGVRGLNNGSFWIFDQNGVLTFPDGTITSGNISSTSNFGFDTRVTNNGFSIITAGTSTGTSQLWEYNTDGSLTFPDGTITSGNISGTSNFGFDTRLSGSGFSIITGTSSLTTQWTFDTDGSIKRNNISMLNFQMEEFKVSPTGRDITNGGSRDIRVDTDNDYIWKFELQHSPISIRKTAFYINGSRLSNSLYSLSNNVITFDITVWDSDPTGNYQFYIDYQY